MEAKIGENWIKILNIGGKACTYDNERIVCNCTENPSDYDVKDGKIVCSECKKEFPVRNQPKPRTVEKPRIIKKKSNEVRDNITSFFKEIAQDIKDNNYPVEAPQGTMTRKVLELQNKLRKGSI